MIQIHTQTNTSYGIQLRVTLCYRYSDCPPRRSTKQANRHRIESSEESRKTTATTNYTTVSSTGYNNSSSRNNSEDTSERKMGSPNGSVSTRSGSSQDVSHIFSVSSS
ncbi:hypothetical protein PoB_001165900 [Plakobranchus ocellatus]|uniref:Uncharacterized protein n=1 Tax=Plakobranchus ocellatus TaxID=259542 RepID=A0AAV3YQ52_9GAST|nr:hypothetical protein PoB_001165900 [Plakobranchus ocellatus]